MIGEAVDTALTLGWALAAHDAAAVPAYLAATVAVAGLLCGHQGQPWPLRRQKPPQPTEPTAGRTRAPNRSTNFLCTRKDPS